MKYQHILNKEILFETNDVSDFMRYLLNNPKAIYAKNSILFNLLESNKGYVCDMATASGVNK